MSNARKAEILVVLAALAVAVLAACATTASLAPKHPVKVAGLPLCSHCHTDWRANLDHTQDYIHRHGLYASQQARTCEVCHVSSFCVDCHPIKEELKPSEKYQDSPQRSLPHRGDYINQHKIDGRLDPASCFPCHGRQNNERCKECHQ
jgi:hypothetical protein